MYLLLMSTVRFWIASEMSSFDFALEVDVEVDVLFIVM